MKKVFPKYEYGDLEKVKEQLPDKSKKILSSFIKKCSITSKTPEKNKKIERHILQFYDVIEKPLDKITKQDVDDFLIVLNNVPEKEKSIWTKNEIKCFVKKFLKMQYKDLEMIDNIHLENQQIAHKINDSSLITEEDIEKMLRSAQNWKEKALLFLAFEMGARPQELADLKWKDIKFENDYADVSLYSKKTGQLRQFPVKKSCYFLKEWKQNYVFSDVNKEDYVFPSIQLKMMGNKSGYVPMRDKRISTAGINDIFRRMTKKAGIEKDIWGYLFRHTRATRLYEELPTPIVEQLMGHKDMYRTYAHISNKKARESMLNNIYKVKEITPEQKDEYEKKIDELQNQIDKIKSNNKDVEYLMNMFADELVERDSKKNKNKINPQTQHLNSLAYGIVESSK